MTSTDGIGFPLSDSEVINELGIRAENATRLTGLLHSIRQRQNGGYTFNLGNNPSRPIATFDDGFNALKGVGLYLSGIQRGMATVEQEQKKRIQDSTARSDIAGESGDI